MRSLRRTVRVNDVLSLRKVAEACTQLRGHVEWHTRTAETGLVHGLTGDELRCSHFRRCFGHQLTRTVNSTSTTNSGVGPQLLANRLIAVGRRASFRGPC